MTTPLSDPQSVHNPATGNVAPATWGDAVRDNIVTLGNMPGCVASRTTAQSIGNGAVTAMQYNAADIRDTDAYHDTVTNNTRLTVPTGLGGMYWVGCAQSLAAVATGYRQIILRLNGATFYTTTLDLASATVGYYNTLQIPMRLVAGDYVEFCLWQNSGAPLNTDAAYVQIGWMQMFAAA